MFEKLFPPLVLQPIVFGKENNEKLGKNITEDISDVLEDLISVLPSITISDINELENLCKADFLLPINLPHWGIEILSKQNYPVILWSKGGFYGAWTKDRHSYLENLGVTVYSFITPDEAKRVIRALRTVKRLKESKIIYFGSLSGLTGEYKSIGVIGSNWNFQKIFEKLGISVKQISNNYLLQCVDKIPEKETKEILEKWKNDFDNFNSEYEKLMLEVVKFYLAIKNILFEQKAKAMTINCLSDLFHKRFVTPCIGLAKLLDEGIIAGCEGDLNTLLTMMIFTFTSDTPSIMGNIYLFRPEKGPGVPPYDVILEDTKRCLKENTARFTHDVIPLTLAKSKYTLGDYHNMGKGITAYATLPSDVSATFGRLDPSLEKIVLTVAKIKEVENSVHCRFSAWLEMENTESYVRNISSHHSAMIYGNWIEELVYLCKILKIEPVIIKKKNEFQRKIIKSF